MFRRTAHRRLFSVEDANSPWAFSDLVELSPSHVDHLMLSLSPAGTPDQPLLPTDALSVTRSSFWPDDDEGD
jgi:hypothetical protein